MGDFILIKEIRELELLFNDLKFQMGEYELKKEIRELESLIDDLKLWVSVIGEFYYNNRNLWMIINRTDESSKDDDYKCRVVFTDIRMKIQDISRNISRLYYKTYVIQPNRFSSLGNKIRELYDFFKNLDDYYKNMIKQIMGME